MDNWEYNDPDEGGYAVEEPQRVRKIIANAELDMQVKDPDSASFKLGTIAIKYGGYMRTAGTYKTVIRVKNNMLTDALEEILILGKVKSKKLYSQEVTDQFEDFNIRLENAHKARKRYLELLDVSTSVTEALLVEKELERLNETIDLLKGKINRMEHLTSYATITVRLSEEVKPGVLGYVGIGIYHSVKWLFVRG